MTKPKFIPLNRREEEDITSKEKLIPISEVKKIIDEMLKREEPYCQNLLETLKDKLDAWAKEKQ